MWSTLYTVLDDGELMLKDADYNLIIRLLNNAVILLKINEFSDFYYSFYVLEPNSVKDMHSVRNTSNNAAKVVPCSIEGQIIYLKWLVYQQMLMLLFFFLFVYFVLFSY